MTGEMNSEGDPSASGALEGLTPSSALHEHLYLCVHTLTHIVIKNNKNESFLKN